MDQPVQQDLFDIKLTDPGKLYIRKFAAVARIIILLGIVLASIHITVTLIMYIRINPDNIINKDFRFEHKVLPYYTAVYCILYFLQFYFYWQVTKCLRKGLKYNDEEVFNKAFHALFRYAVFGLSTMMLSLLFYSFELYTTIKYL